MESKLVNRLCFDFCMGCFIGLVMALNIKIYIVVFFLAVVGMFLIVLTKNDMSTYGHDANEEFSIKIVFLRVFIVNLGVFCTKFLLFLWTKGV